MAFHIIFAFQVLFFPTSKVDFSYFVFVFLSSLSDVKKERQPLSPNNEVIVLSDNEPSSPVMNGLNHFRKTDTDLLMV